MSLASKLLSTSGGESKMFVDDVFSTFTYTGNGATQTINNGIDLAGKGGLVWIKSRSSGSLSHNLFDTARGRGNYLYSEASDAQNYFGADAADRGLTTFDAFGFSLGINGGSQSNTNSATYVSWTFRKAPKFFDVVTYTGNGVANRPIAHSLGIAPGIVTTKSTSTGGSWNTFHQAATGDLVINSISVQSASKAIVSAASATTFTVSGVANTSGVGYVAYLFAHDTSADGFIQCGSYVGNGSSIGPAVTLGWEPQYLMIKNASGSSDWQIIDSMRGMFVGPAESSLQANGVNPESSVEYFSPMSTGFQITSSSAEVNTNGGTYIYLAIRRPNKPPTIGTQVYNAINRVGTTSAVTVTGVGFPPDVVLIKRSTGSASSIFFDKMRGANRLLPIESGTGESTPSDTLMSFDIDGVSLREDSFFQSVNHSLSYINYFFKRASGFLDVVCDTGTGLARTLAHNLGAVPELLIRKARSGGGQWVVYSASITNTEKLVLNSTAAKATDTTAWSSTTPTATAFTVDTGANVNANTTTYVTYLFASLPGISKVFSYTGNGTSLTIDCGFTTGARFILIKRTDAVGDWYVWDTVRGIVAANDPHLSLNTTAVEVTTNDSIDPATSGFIVNQNTATNINVTAGTYIGLAIA